MNLQELEAKVKSLENQVRSLQDIEEIKKLQRIYGYYLDYGMNDEIIDLFSDNPESIEIADHGVFLGKEGVQNFFREVLGQGGKKMPPELSLHLVMQHQGVVNVASDGKTAKGRWHGWMVGVMLLAGVMRQIWGHGVYENEYVKEHGQWKFKKIHFNLNFQTPYEDGWLKTPVVRRAKDYSVRADKPPTAYHPYPYGYQVPIHWRNPTDAKQNERIRKKRIK